MSKKLLRLMLVFTMFALIAGVGYYSRSPAYYPLVVVDATDDLTLTFLQQSTPDVKACEALAATIASLMRANCPRCKVTKQQCLNDLSRDLRDLLSDRAISTPSARILKGVIAYSHPDPRIALATCLESQAQAAANNQKSKVSCIPANTPRPFIQEHRQFAEATQSVIGYFARSIAVLASGLAIFFFIQLFSARSPTDAIGVPLTTEGDFKISRLAKRVTDILVSVLLLAILLPLLFFISVLVFVLEGFPIFYISRRYISLDRCVSILKFRTMVKDATSPKYRLRERYMRNGYLDIPLDCEVYTPIGRFLERTQLVEVLQLFNILFHGMSLIGNRPLPRENIDLLKQFSGWQGRFDSPAGLTGLSQVVGKLNQGPHERLELECLYSSVYKGKSGNIFLCDLYILFYTVRFLLFGKPLSIEGAKQLVANVTKKCHATSPNA